MQFDVAVVVASPAAYVNNNNNTSFVDELYVI